MNRFDRAASAASLAVFWLTLLLTAACSGKPHGAEAAPDERTIAECDAYLATLATCRPSSSRGTANPAHDAMNARFLAAAKADDATRARFRERCAEGHAALVRVCGGAR